uniref:G domain-containing protein n=1 Tax=Globodera rostochiensis TaxID=31243 RepID=A0A914H944_GLORO
MPSPGPRPEFKAQVPGLVPNSKPKSWASSRIQSPSPGPRPEFKAQVLGLVPNSKPKSWASSRIQSPSPGPRPEFKAQVLGLVPNSKPKSWASSRIQSPSPGPRPEFKAQVLGLVPNSTLNSLVYMRGLFELRCSPPALDQRQQRMEELRIVDEPTSNQSISIIVLLFTPVAFSLRRGESTPNFGLSRDKSAKRLVLMLNKIDLVPRENLLKWLAHLRQQLPTIAFKASTQEQNKKLGRYQRTLPNFEFVQHFSAKCIGADLVMKLLGNYCRNKDIKTSIRVGIVGFPNVGKSSVINSLKRRKCCQTGALPGLTRQVQEVELDKHIRLIDSPGVVLAPKGTLNDAAELSMRNAVRVAVGPDQSGQSDSPSMLHQNVDAPLWHSAI